MKSYKKLKQAVTPFQLLVMGYMAVTLTGAILLSLPVSTASGNGQSFLDSLFVATSGISTSGLSVVDIGSFYTIFGQVVLLCIFQIGGIGYMSIILFLTQMFGMRTSILTQIVAKESLAGPGLRQLGRFFIATIIFTLIFELAGALILSLFWMKEFPAARAVWLGVFHSVSTFCTAGFGLFADSLMRYRGDTVMNLTINVLSLAGGLGFFVLYEVYLNVMRTIKSRRRRRLSVHSKLVLAMTAVIVLAGSVVIFIAEHWDPSMGLFDRVLASTFQAISASTTDGFNSIDIGKMCPACLMALIVLMFVGASPGSTGGGIKTTTLGVVILFLYSQLRGREDSLNLFEREIPLQSVTKAYSIFTWFMFIILADLMVMLITENANFQQVLFEVVSALGNTGLSTGITSGLSTTGRIMLIITMFIGRVGPLTIGFFIVGKQKPLSFRYAEEDVFIG